VNRRTANAKRCTFEPKELADVTIEFYRRNYIEGLFLSSAVIGSPDNTAEMMYKCLYLLREVYEFSGYIHTKVIPGTSPELLHKLGFVTDRLSVNIELPSSESLGKLAPQKNAKGIFLPMQQITQTQAEQRTLKSAGYMDRLRPPGAVPIRRDYAPSSNPVTAFRPASKYKERFAPAGQTTQMIIGASPESDRHILRTSEALYRKFSLKRVYFSAYIPVADTPELPALLTPPPLRREHRLYQADWLLRFYGFSSEEILPEDAPNLDWELDPKASWALRNIGQFPIEVNKASLAELLRIPGVGNVSAERILKQRRMAAVGYDDLKKMGVVLKRARFFLTCSGKYYGDKVFEPVYIRDKVLRTESTAAKSSLANHRNDASTLLDPDRIRSAVLGGENPQISMFEALEPLKIPSEQTTSGVIALEGAAHR
jgi:putative DNA modification/repair radical SAM protein